MFFSPFGRRPPVENDLRLSFQLEAFASGLLLAWPHKEELAKLSTPELASFVTEEAEFSGVLQPSIASRFKDWIGDQAPRVIGFLKTVPEPVPVDFQQRVLRPESRGLRSAFRQDASFHSWLRENLNEALYESLKGTLDEISDARRDGKVPGPRVSEATIEIVSLTRDFFDVVAGLLKRGITIAAGDESFSVSLASTEAAQQRSAPDNSRTLPKGFRRNRLVTGRARGTKHAVVKTGSPERRLVNYAFRGKALAVRRDEWDRTLVAGGSKARSEVKRLIKAGWIETKGKRVLLVPKFKQGDSRSCHSNAIERRKR